MSESDSTTEPHADGNRYSDGHRHVHTNADTNSSIAGRGPGLYSRWWHLSQHATHDRYDLDDNRGSEHSLHC